MPAIVNTIVLENLIAVAKEKQQADSSAGLEVFIEMAEQSLKDGDPNGYYVKLER